MPSPAVGQGIGKDICLPRKEKEGFSEGFPRGALLQLSTQGWLVTKPDPSCARLTDAYGQHKRQMAQKGKTLCSVGLVSSGQLAICAHFIQKTLKFRLIYVSNGPELTLGALGVFRHLENEITGADIRNDFLQKPLLPVHTAPENFG